MKYWFYRKYCGKIGTTGNYWGDTLFWNSDTSTLNNCGSLFQYSVIMGNNADRSNRGENAIAIGYEAGQISQQQAAITIGYQAGTQDQKEYAIAIGTYACNINQQSAIAICPVICVHNFDNM